MAKTFAGEAAGDVRDLATNLKDVASGFREVTKEVTGYIALQRENLDLSRQKVAVLAAVGSGVSAGGIGGAGVLAGVNAPGGGAGVLAGVNLAGGGGGVLAGVNRAGGGSGVLVSVNGADIGQEVAAQMGRRATAGEKTIARTLSQGFTRLEETIRSGARGDGGAAFRANGGV